eukprot:1063066-Pelagomonas_calceolata.AAC.8
MGTPAQPEARVPHCPSSRRKKWRYGKNASKLCVGKRHRAYSLWHRAHGTRARLCKCQAG